MALWLEAEEQRLLLESLGELVQARGPAPLLAAPIEPTEAFFPDRYTPGAEGARVVAERLLGYAGLPRHRAVVEVGGGREAAPAGHEGHDGSGAAAWFTGVEGFRCFFGVAERHLDDPESLVAALAHEVAHAFRRIHGLEGQGALPEEPATDATTVFLGFGVLTTNAAFRYRTYGAAGTSYAGHWISQSRLGYLPPQAMAYLLAAQALGRRAGWGERRRLAGLLETNQAAAFRTAHAALARREAEVLTRLGIPSGARGLPAPRPTRAVEPPVAAASAPLAAPRAAPPQPHGRPTFRVPGGPRRVAGLVAATVSAAPFLIVAIGARRPWVLALAAPLSTWSAVRFGQHRPDRCSDPECEADLPAAVQACPGCGRRIAGTIARPQDRLEAEERLRAQDALDREALGDGAPRAEG